MRKQVYLFELDSVRKTNKEVIQGQRALYDEIVVNGNVVVLTYNQLVDSRAFFSLFNNKEYQENLIHLFENGAIRISQFGEIRSLSQYLINSVETDKKFIYSALPVKYTQKHLLALIKRSLIYSDMSELHEYCTKIRTEVELEELFLEVEENQCVHESFLMNGVREGRKEYKTAIQEMYEILDSIYNLLTTVLRLSTMHDIYIQPKDVKEYNGMQLHDIIRAVTTLEHSTDCIWEEAVSVIQTLKAYKDNSNNRSIYIRELKEYSYEVSDPMRLKSLQYAEAMINLCYNYACEISICNISKHYNVEELHPDYKGKKESFTYDFIHRLDQDWNDGVDAEIKYLGDETTSFVEFDELKKIPDFATAVRYTEYVSYRGDLVGDSVIRYEYKLKEKNLTHKLNILKTILAKAGFAIVCLFLACLAEFVFNFVQDAFDAHATILPMVEMLVFLFLTEFITSLISMAFPRFLSLSEALGSMGVLIKDSFIVAFRNAKIYTSNNICENSIEKKSKGVSIEYILSPELKKYISLRNTNKVDNLFSDSDIYPIADINNSLVRKQIIRLEERFNCKFGVVYQSRFNQMLVDPICKEDSLFPYERVIPKADANGVVMLTMINDSFVLLEQYRHAPRAKQICFPRGFGESNQTSVENAKRELKEEIGAVVSKEPILLGQIISDSGLTSGVADVYYVDIDSYELNTETHEGIKKIIVIPKEKMDAWISDGNTNDGFTLSAYALFKNSCLA